MNINVYIYTYEQPTKLSDDEQSSKKLPWTLKQLTKPAQPIRDHPKPIPHNPKRTQGISFRQALGALFMMFMESLCFYFFLSFCLSVCLSFSPSFFLVCLLGCLSHRSCVLEPCFRMFLKEIGRTHRYSNRYQPILSLYHFDPRSDHPSVELNKFNLPRPAGVKTCDYHSFTLNAFLHTRLGKKRLGPQLKVHGLLSLLWAKESAILLFMFS